MRDADGHHVSDREHVGWRLRRRRGALGLERPGPGHRGEGEVAGDPRRQLHHRVGPAHAGDDAGVDLVGRERPDAGRAREYVGDEAAFRQARCGVRRRLGVVRLLRLLPRLLLRGVLPHGRDVDGLQIRDPGLVRRLRDRSDAAPERGAIRVEPVALELQLRAAPALALVDGAEVLADRDLGRVLQLRVHRHFHRQPGGVDRRVAELRDQLAPDLVHVPGAGRLRRRSRQHDGLLHLAIVLLGGDVVVGQHPIEHVDLALLRALGMAAGVDAGRVLRQAGEDGRFSHVDLLDVLVEVVERGLFHAVARLPEVDLVQVEKEDVVLREVPLEARGQQDFF